MFASRFELVLIEYIDAVLSQQCRGDTAALDCVTTETSVVNLAAPARRAGLGQHRNSYAVFVAQRESLLGTAEEKIGNIRSITGFYPCHFGDDCVAITGMNLGRSARYR